MAFSATVDPWRSSHVSPSRSSSERVISFAATASDSRMPSAKSGGVENALATVVTPDYPTTTVSAHVPPTSTPTMKAPWCRLASDGVVLEAFGGLGVARARPPRGHGPQCRQSLPGRGDGTVKDG